MKKPLRSASLLFFAASALLAADTTFWIAPCDNPDTGCKAGDDQLARWALDAWQAASGGRLHFVQTTHRADAQFRFLWAAPTGALFGETVPIEVNGRHGAQIFIVNQTQTITDPLLRDTIVYLTCLHESGHALGLQHTNQFDDIMYFFGYGGNIDEYFGRYRDRLKKRDDIRKYSGLSPADRRHLLDDLRAAHF
jgi:Matrixin